jgi:predicted nucleic acid-binding protein
MLVADTGVVYAALDRTDADHDACTSLLGSGAAVTIPAPVVFEVDWLARTRGFPRAIDLLLTSIVDESVLVVDLDQEDYLRVRDLVRRYADLPLDTVDASVVAVAERLEQDTIATLDRRHFSGVRPSHTTAFTLVPELS